MQIPCDTIGQAVATYLDAGDFTPASRTTYRRVLEGMARALGPERALAELDADELTAWFKRTRATHGPAAWNRDRVIVRSFVRHLQHQGVAVELPALEHHRVRPDTTRALPRARVEQILTAPAPLRDKTLWRMLYESAARVGEVLALDVEDLDLANRRARVVGKGGQVEWITWSTGTATLLPRLLRGRRSVPVLTTRRPSRVTPAVLDRAPDGTARLSYRRAEELFKAATSATLHQLRHSALTHMAEDGASAPMLMSKSRHQSITSLARPPRRRGPPTLGSRARPGPPPTPLTAAAAGDGDRPEPRGRRDVVIGKSQGSPQAEMRTEPADSPEAFGRARNQTRNRSRHRRRKPVEIPAPSSSTTRQWSTSPAVAAVIENADRSRP